MKFVVVLFALAVCAAAEGALPTAIPKPGFGLTEQPGSPTVFVDNQNPAAVDTNNPNGTRTKPRRTVPTALAAGTVVEVRGGPYDLGNGLTTWTSSGTQAKPVFVMGVGNPVFRGNGSTTRIRSAGAFMVIDGFTFTGIQHEVFGNAVAIRDSDIGYIDATAVIITGQGDVIVNNSIHENGNADSPVEHDTHGVIVVPGSNYTWVLQNQIYRNGGDGVQIGSDSVNSIRPTNVFIGGNTIHEDRENAIDIKRAQDVIVSQNFIYGYVVRDSSAGEAIVTHAGPELVWIVNNVVANSQQGIVCTGARGYYVVGNIVMGIRHNPNYAYDPNSLWGASGVLTYNTDNAVHVNNTIWASDAGISIPTGTVIDVVNNIAGGLTGASAGIRVADVVRRNGSTVGNNLDINPGFASASDLRLTFGSPAIDAGVMHWVYGVFSSRYKVAIDRDFSGGRRVVGASIDLGALEYQGAGTSAPSVVPQ